MFKRVKFNNSVEFFEANWRGGGPSFISPINGESFSSSYPFKKFLISTDAPAFDGPGNPKNLTINIKVGIEKGDIYDLSKISNLRARPLMVSEKRDGSYVVVKDSTTQKYTKQGLENFRVPLFINSGKMESFDSLNPDKNSLTVSIEYDNNGNQKINDKSKIFLVIEKRRFSQNNSIQTAEEREKFSTLVGAELLSFSQLKARGAYDSNDVFQPNSNFMKNKVRYLFMDAYPKMGYVSIGALHEIMQDQSGGGLDLGNYSEYVRKAYLKSLETPETRIFSLFRDNQVPPVENYNSDIFIRI